MSLQDAGDTSDEARWRAEFPTQTPCPAWCTRAPGHPYRFGLLDWPHEGRYHRTHSRQLGDLSTWDLGLTLSQLETASSPSGARVLLPPAVDLEAPHCAAELGRTQSPAADLWALAHLFTGAAAELMLLTLDTEPDAHPDGARS